MTPADRAHPRDFVIAAAIAAASALVMGLIMANLGAPPDHKVRLAALDQKLGDAKALGRTLSDGPALPAGAICTKPPVEESQVLSNSLHDLTTKLKLDIARLEVAPEAAAAGSDHLAAVNLHVEAGGSYEGAIALLDGLSKQSPRIYADTVDLTSKGSSVTIAFSGRAFCAV